MKDFRTRRRAPQKLLVFARLPQEGRVKTRLASEIGAGRALELYRAMLDDVLESIGDSDDQIDVDLAWTAAGEVAGEALRRAFGERDLSMQSGRDLGERLIVAFSERVIFQPTEKIVAIGVDDPSLGREDVLRAFHLLDSCEWVVGPASDGGYYLIGCRAAAFHPSVFEKIEWGSPRVLARTEESIRALGA
ncbi:MAG TPA: TIGR04282 family arsenosugar biosynthesis glycosyltransferase, partial [Thermoanaerobaculia bacterium]|nr:TIGR04282 family arsenosugar biosynthesis glycosyltransferase [Thermoanaerobaculia bacterium]